MSKHKKKRKVLDTDWDKVYERVPAQSIKGSHGVNGAQPIHTEGIDGKDPSWGFPLSRAGRPFHPNSYIGTCLNTPAAARAKGGNNPHSQANLVKARKSKMKKEGSLVRTRARNAEAFRILTDEFFQQVHYDDGSKLGVKLDNVIQKCGRVLMGALDHPNVEVQIRAAQEILDRTIGKPTQSIRHEGMAPNVLIQNLLNVQGGQQNGIPDAEFNRQIIDVESRPRIAE